MATENARYVFLPWVRQGAAAALRRADTLGAAQRAEVTMPVQLRLQQGGDVQVDVRLIGPSEVTGIDPAQVIRTDPAANATEFEPNYFPAVEFARPDFPWLFTPASAKRDGRLRPWIALVVVREMEGVTIRTGRELPLPVLDIAAPAVPGNELPDLSESWAWAHAQVAGAAMTGAALQEALKEQPETNISRLLCPRKLEPETRYFACVVPAFDVGRKSGLNLNIDASELERLEPAWRSGAQSPDRVTLPVYFHWRFRTGHGADFESLVRLLEARPLPDGVGKREIDIRRPGFGVGDGAGDTGQGTLGLPGALQPPGAQPSAWADAARMKFQEDLTALLNMPGAASETTPLVAPPIYGTWQAAVRLLTAAGGSPRWLHDLNLDPRDRAAAGFGTRVIQDKQEQLVAAAWDQIGEIQAANRRLRVAQLARLVNSVYYQTHFLSASPEVLMHKVAPASRRLQVANFSLQHHVSLSRTPSSAVSAAMRRIVRPRGKVGRRLDLTSLAATKKASSVFSTGFHQPVLTMMLQSTNRPVTVNTVSAGIASLAKTVRYELATSTAVRRARSQPRYSIVTEGRTIPPVLRIFGRDNKTAAAFRSAATAHQQHMQRAFQKIRVFPAPALKLSTIKTNVLRQINPENALVARVQGSVRIGGAVWRPTVPLDPVMNAPRYPQPMYAALRDLSQDLLLPGLALIPQNTVTLLETNDRFVEAFMVGLNTEMGRELLWREYPTDQRATFFRQFWDRRGTSGSAQDIPPIHRWHRGRRLGNNSLGSGTTQLVLLIRGQLLQRYPNAVIYAIKAVRGRKGKGKLSTQAKNRKLPVFRGTLHPDMTFMGFDLEIAEALGESGNSKKPGWYFIIQEQPTEPRFGLDVASGFAGTIAKAQSWNELSWGHTADDQAAFDALHHLSVRAPLPDTSDIVDSRPAQWGRNSAHQAYATLQQPVRIAIHARNMIP